MKQSNFMSLNWLDMGKALLVALIAFLLDYAQTTFVPSLNISPEIKIMLITALAYVAKNFFTKPKPEIKEVQANEVENNGIGLPYPKK